MGLVGAFVADDGVTLGVLRNSLLSIGAGQVVASRFGISLIWLPSLVVALVAIFLGAEEGDRPLPGPWFSSHRQLPCNSCARS